MSTNTVSMSRPKSFELHSLVALFLKKSIHIPTSFDTVSWQCEVVIQPDSSWHWVVCRIKSSSALYLWWQGTPSIQLWFLLNFSLIVSVWLKRFGWLWPCKLKLEWQPRCCMLFWVSVEMVHLCSVLLWGLSVDAQPCLGITSYFILHGRLLAPEEHYLSKVVTPTEEQLIPTDRPDRPGHRTPGQAYLSQYLYTSLCP